MSGWQPIETAPRDGTKLLLWCPSLAGGPVIIAAGDDDEYWPWADCAGRVHKRVATHWMPLPEPPESPS